MSGNLKTTSRQALLLFTQEFRKERKNLGFGKQMDHSVHLALQYRTADLLSKFEQTDIVIVHGGTAPQLGNAHYLPERGQDFNSRFIHALQDTFALGYERVVAVGGDIPGLQSEDISAALATDDLVIGPTYDGGFYLAALTQEDIPLFNNLPWRQQSLLDQLTQRLHQTQRNYLLIARRKDIDHAADARRTATLLIKLVRQWLKYLRLTQNVSHCIFLYLTDRLPEPRYHSRPPPQRIL